MHRLPRNVDLSFLINKVLLQVCIGANEMILNFDNEVSITVESDIGLIGTTEKRDTYMDFRNAAPAVVRLIEDVIVLASGDESGTLTLQFKSGITLELFDSSDRYESYQIRNGDRLIVV